MPQKASTNCPIDYVAETCFGLDAIIQNHQRQHHHLLQDNSNFYTSQSDTSSHMYHDYKRMETTIAAHHPALAGTVTTRSAVPSEIYRRFRSRTNLSSTRDYSRTNLSSTKKTTMTTKRRSIVSGLVLRTIQCGKIDPADLVYNLPIISPQSSAQSEPLRPRRLDIIDATGNDIYADKTTNTTAHAHSQFKMDVKKQNMKKREYGDDWPLNPSPLQPQPRSEAKGPLLIEWTPDYQTYLNEALVGITAEEFDLVSVCDELFTRMQTGEEVDWSYGNTSGHDIFPFHAFLESIKV